MKGSRFEKCWSHQKKMLFLHIQQKGFTLLLFLFFLRWQAMRKHQGMTICSHYCRKRPGDGHFPMLQVLFCQFPLRLFSDCVFLGGSYFALTNSCRFLCLKSPSAFPTLYCRHPPHTRLTFWTFRIISVLPFWSLQIAASV